MLIKLVGIRLSAMARGQNNEAKGKKKKGKNTLLLYLFLMLYMGLVFGFLFFSSYMTLFDQYCAALNLDSVYFAMSATTAVMLGVVGSVFITQNQLFEAKDNELLLSMPIKPSQILLSRIISLYLWAFFFGAVSSVPALIVYSMGKSIGALSVIVAIVELFVIPLLSLTISILIALILQYLSRFVKNKSIFVIIGTFILLGVYLYVVNKLTDFTQYLADNAAAIAELYKTKLYPFYICGEAMTGDPLSILIMLLVYAGPFVILFAILSKVFVNLITTKRGIAKTKYVAGRLKTSSVRDAITKKEMLRFIKSAVYATNGGTGMIMQVVVAVLVLLKYNTITDVLESLMGDKATNAAIAIAIVAVAFTASLVEITICSISMEGNMLWILKSAPIPTVDILKAKIKAHLIMAVPFAVVSGIILNIALPMNILQRVLAVVLPVALQVFNAYFGLAVNLKFPKLDWINEAYAVKQSTAAFIGAIGSMVTVIVVLILSVALGNIFGYDLVLIVITALLILGTLAYVRYVPTKGVKRFEEL